MQKQLNPGLGYLSAPAVPGLPVHTTETMIVSGMTCPMNFMKAKLTLKKLSICATLKVITYDGVPIQTMPAGIRSQCQNVTNSMAIENGLNLFVVQ